MVKKAKAKAKKPVAKKKGPVVLPMVLSKLIGICLRDIRKAEKAKHIIDMGTWYEPKQDIVCATDSGVVVDKYQACVMCAAGSVMMYSLASEAQKKKSLQPSDFENNEAQLKAIDNLRGGNPEYAMVNLFPEESGYNSSTFNKLSKLNADIPEYEPMDPEPFHTAMKKFQAKLETAGY